MKKNVKRAIITGITGQDGSYLAELLLMKGYEVHGIRRRTSFENTQNLHMIDITPQKKKKKLFLHYADMLDTASINYLTKEIKPDEFYNLAAQSHVHYSFQAPDYTTQVNAISVIKILEGIAKLSPKTKFYQASTSEIYGDIKPFKSINEKTPFNPCSPYANSKLFSHHLVQDFKNRGLFCVNGILFNHESPRRPVNFVTMKVIDSAIKIKSGLMDCLYIGNMYSYRDWGYAPEYVEAMWRMLNINKTPKDYIISTSKSYMIKYFINFVFNKIGFKLKWMGKGIDEYAIDALSKKVIIRVDPYYFRPNEVGYLKGSYFKAKKEINWQPRTNISKLIEIMINSRAKYLNLEL